MKKGLLEEMEQKRFEWGEIFKTRIILFGIILVFLIPPIQAADENVHFLNAYAFSKGDFFPEYEAGTYTGRTFPKDIISYVEIWDADEDRRASIEEAMRYPGPQKINESDEKFYPYWASETNMVGYIFSGTGMWLCKLIFGMIGIPVSGYDLLIAGRFCNLLFYGTVVYFAIKITPCYKRTMLALALMPMSIFQSATLSYDAILIPSCFLLFALILQGLYSEEKITSRKLCIMCAISIILFNVKTVYAPLLLGLAFIPKEQFGGKKKYIMAGISIVGCGLGVFLLNGILSSIYTQGYVNPYGELYAGQIQHLTHNLIGFIIYIINSIKKYCDFYFISFVGTIGKLDFPFPSIILLYYGIFLLFIMWNDSGNEKAVKCGHKLLLASVIGLIIYISYAALYCTWTAIDPGIGVNWVEGFQGRYLIPIAIYVPVLFSYQRKKRRNRENIMNEIVYYTVTVFPAFTLLFELLRFWNI